MVSSIVSGTPSAIPARPAKLDRMSFRTTPLRPSTLGPFDPSPGYGPCVSSGIRLLHDDVPPAGAVVGFAEASVGLVVLLEHASNCNAPTLAPNRAASRSRPRRSISAPVAS